MVEDGASEPLLPRRGPAPGDQQLEPPAGGGSSAAGAAAQGNSGRSSGWRTMKLHKGMKLAPAAAAISVGLAIRFLAPIPEGLDGQAWSLLSLFVTVVLGLVLAPLPTGAWALLGATTALATHTLTYEQMFSAATNSVVGLVIMSFLLAKGFEKTGLGGRIASQLLSRCGTSTLGLSLGLVASDALLTTAMPSTTSRAAGIFVPVISSVASASGSNPGDDSRLKLGAFLTQAQLQASSNSSSFLLTAAAQNLLCMRLASGVGVDVPNMFVTWMVGASVPAALGVVVAPCLLYWLSPPAIRSTPDAPAAAAARLEQMGPMSDDERIMAGAVALAVSLWVFGGSAGVEPVTAAMLALGMLLATGVLTWQDCLECNAAWDTLIWFMVLISMSLGLQSLGVIDCFSGWAGEQLAALGLPWPWLFLLLHATFLWSHYLFASQTAHVACLYPAWLSLMIASGVPPQLAALSLAYNINLNGSLTHYASGQSVVYYGSGYLRVNEIITAGAACSLASFTIWSTAGMLWWHLLGWW